jgi:hypothetical protein
MKHILTEHARKRCVRRAIDPAWIAHALDHPARIESDPDDDSLAHVLWPVPERGFRVLRVIYNETVDPVTVVTAYFDDKVTGL